MATELEYKHTIISIRFRLSFGRFIRKPAKAVSAFHKGVFLSEIEEGIPAMPVKMRNIA